MREGKRERKEAEISRAEEGTKPSSSYIHGWKVRIPKKTPSRKRKYPVLSFV